jgi:hypothetical protein
MLLQESILIHLEAFESFSDQNVFYIISQNYIIFIVKLNLLPVFLLYIYYFL